MENIPAGSVGALAQDDRGRGEKLFVQGQNVVGGGCGISAREL